MLSPQQKPIPTLLRPPAFANLVKTVMYSAVKRAASISTARTSRVAGAVVCTFCCDQTSGNMHFHRHFIFCYFEFQHYSVSQIPLKPFPASIADKALGPSSLSSVRTSNSTHWLLCFALDCVQACTTDVLGQQRRNLNVHEYISMDLMKQYGVPVPRCHVASTPDEAEEVYASHLCGGGTNTHPKPYGL